MSDKPKRGPLDCPKHGYTNYIHKGKSGTYMGCPICKIEELELRIAELTEDWRKRNDKLRRGIEHVAGNKKTDHFIALYLRDLLSSAAKHKEEK